MANIVSTCNEVISSLGIDRALLRIQSVVVNGSDTVSLWLQSAECYRCSLVETCLWNNSGVNQLTVDTRYPILLSIRRGITAQNICQLQEHFGEHGIYNLTISDGGCSVEKMVEPVRSNLPILYVFIAYMVLWFAYCAAKFVRSYWKNRRTDLFVDTTHQQGSSVSSSSLPPEDVAAAVPETNVQRYRSLDTLRGIVIAIMIFVNLGGGGYYFFAHSPWNGLTVADLVFPWFLFVMGFSVILSLTGRIRKGIPIRIIWRSIASRSAILFSLGLFLNGISNNNLRSVRIFGVLQRIGIVYFFIGTLLCLRFLRSLSRTEEHDGVRSRFADLKNLRFEWLAISLLVVLHTCITFFITVPGCPRGYLGPGGLADNGRYSNCTGGSAGYIDRTVLTWNHMYKSPTFKAMYQTNLPYDPEGILGLLTSTLTVFFGVQAGLTLSTYSSHRSRMIRWILWALFCGGVGLGLCGVSKNDGWIPINKNLWSLSYVLVMASLSFTPLVILYYVIDVKHWWNGGPFYQAGMNSIFLYTAHECFGQYLPFTWRPLICSDIHLSLLAMNVWATSLFMVTAIYLHYKRIYISL